MLNSIIEDLKNLDIEKTLAYFHEKFADKIVFSTSFGNEDQVITDFIFKSKISVHIFTLDTGRVFQETYLTWDKTNTKYKTKIQSYNPDSDQLEYFLQQHGPNAFYDSVELRKECCNIRKIQPLKKALKGYKIWITGIRADQSPERTNHSILEWDEANQIIKYNPLIAWTWDEVKNYIKDHQVPYNSLHDKGFVSIGCIPCTRAISAGEDFRAGRWWWEDASKKECGLHSS